MALTGQPTARCVALTVLAAARIRTGSADPAPLLAEAAQLARRMDELQRIGPVTAARCEAAALREDWAAIVADAVPVHAEAARLRTSALQAELAYWLRRAGREVEVPDTDHPYALQARGDWLGAAAAGNASALLTTRPRPWPTATSRKRSCRHWSFWTDWTRRRSLSGCGPGSAASACRTCRAGRDRLLVRIPPDSLLASRRSSRWLPAA